MKKISILIMCILLTGCAAIDKPAEEDQVFEMGGVPCLWVYKTNEDYFDLHAAAFDEEFKKSEMRYGVRDTFKLNKSYTGYSYGCYMPRYFAFINISVSKYKEAKIKVRGDECWTSLMEPFIKKMIEEKCSKTDFDKFYVEEYPHIITSLSKEGIIIESDALRIKYINKEGTRDFCGAMVSPEEKEEFYSIKNDVDVCIDTIPRPEILDNLVNWTYLAENIVDKDPFTEFYLCRGVDIAEVNEIINNNQLDVKCEKQI
ncbi:hypothetical protein ACFLZ7_04200 [Nanoarchaeota archaeon]